MFPKRQHLWNAFLGFQVICSWSIYLFSIKYSHLSYCNLTLPLWNLQTKSYGAAIQTKPLWSILCRGWYSGFTNRNLTFLGESWGERIIKTTLVCSQHLYFLWKESDIKQAKRARTWSRFVGFFSVDARWCSIYVGLLISLLIYL